MRGKIRARRWRKPPLFQSVSVLTSNLLEESKVEKKVEKKVEEVKAPATPKKETNSPIDNNKAGQELKNSKKKVRVEKVILLRKKRRRRKRRRMRTLMMSMPGIKLTRSTWRRMKGRMPFWDQTAPRMRTMTSSLRTTGLSRWA